MSTRIDLPPELEAFTRDCVTSGRYSDTNDVIRAALRRLQDAEARRHSFNAMLADTRAEADRDGTYGIDTVIAEIEASIDIRAGDR
jgi:antitoxin ParD1/3/4